MYETPDTTGQHAHAHNETPMHMTLEEMTSYVTKNWERSPLPKDLPHAATIECIDDRRTGHPSECIAGDAGKDSVRKSIAYPGGALGVLGTLLAATNESIIGVDAEGTHNVRAKLPLSSIITFFEREFKGTSCHTDSHSIGNERACAGCGHAAAMLSNPAYGLGAEYQAGLDVYAKEIQKRKEKNDLNVTVYNYDGEHKACAVVRIVKEPSEDTYISLPPNDTEHGMFVINEATGLHILEMAGKKMYKEFETILKDAGITEQVFLQNVVSAYGTQVGLTAKKLAHGLPVYDVIGEGDKVLVTRSTLAF